MQKEKFTYEVLPEFKQRLLEDADWLEANVSQDMFDMEDYRKGDLLSPVCNSVGCAVGHLTGKYPEDFEDDAYLELQVSFTDRVVIIDFSNWSSIKYFGGEWREIDDVAWEFLFSGRWSSADNTVKGAANRMRTYANGEWDGTAP